jgi:hypothetical protein
LPALQDMPVAACLMSKERSLGERESHAARPAAMTAQFYLIPNSPFLPIESSRSATKRGDPMSPRTGLSLFNSAPTA